MEFLKVRNRKIDIKTIVFIFSALYMFASNYLYAEEVVINQPVVISETNADYDNKSIIIDGVEVTINGTHQFENLKLINNAVLTHSPGNRMGLIVDGTLELIESSIDVSGKGSLPSEFSALYSGGSHAGMGGAPLGSSSAYPYGSYQNPVTAGLGGRSGAFLINDETSTRGGGVIKIQVANLILENGSIVSYGESGSNQGFAVAGGSGGSIWINAQNINSNGARIAADGFSGEGNYAEDGNWFSVGDGAGGRVHLTYAQSSAPINVHPWDWDNTFRLSAQGGGNPWSSSYRGGQGTIYVENVTEQQSFIYVNGSNNLNSAYPDDISGLTPISNVSANLTLLDTYGAKVKIDGDEVNFSINSGSKIIFPENVIVNAMLSGSTFIFKKDVHFVGPLVQGEMTVEGLLTVHDDQLVVENTQLTLKQSQQFDSIEVKSGGYITTFPALVDDGNPFTLSANIININEGGLISVGYKGLSTHICDDCYHVGFSHGGKGSGDGDGRDSPPTYGNYREPVNVGKGNYNPGGALKLVTANLIVDGYIDANSSDYTASAGSIWIIADSITSNNGSAGISASSTWGDPKGGGGRIAIYYKTMTGLDLARVTAYGVSPGTIYVKKIDSDEPGTLIIKSNILSGYYAYTDVVLQDETEKLVIDTARVSLSGTSSLNPDSSIKNSTVTILDPISLAQMPVMENVTLNFQSDMVIGENVELQGEVKFNFLNDLTLEHTFSGSHGFPLINVGGELYVVGDKLRVDGYTLELSKSLELDEIDIINEGVITTAKPIDENSSVVNLIASVIRIDSNSKIDVTGKGLKANSGGTYTGGSHGGSGGDSYYYWNGPPGPIYGDAVSPQSFGRGAALYYEPSFGGGAIKIKTDLLELGGSILAEGQNANQHGGGSAAGGSVWLDVGVLKFQNNSAVISVNGSDGNPQVSHHAAGGGGGRVAVWYESLDNVDIANVTAKGGLQANSSYARAGAPGTVYFHNKNNSNEHSLIIRGAGTDSSHARAGLISIPDDISIDIDSVDIFLPENSSFKNVDVKNSRVYFSEGFSVVGGIKINKSDITFSGELDLGADLFISNKSYVTFNNSTAIQGHTTIDDSQIGFYNNAIFNQLDLIHANVSFHGDLTINGLANLTNSYIYASNDLIAREKVNLNTRADNTFIESYSLSENYLSANGNLLNITADTTEEDEATASFKVVRGLGGANSISFQSSSNPGAYLCVVNQRLELATDDSTESFSKQATFYIKNGNASYSQMSFESMAYPGTFILHKNNELWVESINDWEGNSNSTWMLQDSSAREIYLNNPSTIEVRNNASFESGFEGFGPVTPRVVVGQNLALPNNDLIASGLSISLAQHHTFNDIELSNYGEITIPSAGQTGRVNKGLNLVANNVVIDKHSKIDLSAKERDFNQWTGAAGGSHGGKGGNNGSSISSEVFGEAEQPTSVGLSGVNDWYNMTNGGSAFKLIAENVDLNGAILANGENANNYLAAAAGGSIWLIVNSITSTEQTGRIKADGGSAVGLTKSAGGGGRIALYYQSISGIDDTNVTVNGGLEGIAPSEPGSVGSIYRKTGSVPPYVISIASTPLTNVPVEHLTIQFNAPIDVSTLNSTNITITNENQQSILVSDVVEITETEFQLIFSPGLSDGSYTLTLSPSIQGKNGLMLDQNKNLIPGEVDDGFANSFAVDTTQPAVPVFNAYPEVTTLGVYEFTGIKEANTRLRLNGNIVFGDFDQTVWSHSTNLVPGINNLEYTLEDRAGNVSSPVIVTITFDNTPPAPVSIEINPNGDGRQVHLDWSQYDNAANGNDIALYRVYVSTTNYETVTQLTPVRTLGAHTKWVTLNNLIRGQNYFIAVVAYDMAGLFTNTVNTTAVTPVDKNAPYGLSNLIVNPGLDFLQLSWNKASNTDGDLAYYRISYNDQGQPKSINLDQASLGNIDPITYQLTGLTPASAHDILVSAVDNSGNTSAPLSNSGVTLLSNPTGVTSEALSGSVDISWSPVAPYSLIKHYSVYVSTNIFGSVEGMTPTKIVHKGSSPLKTTLTGLTNGQKIYVAVTTVNNSNGEYKIVTPIEVTPQDDIEGPVIAEAKYTQGSSVLDLGSSPVLTANGKITIKATDKSKVSRVVLSLNGNSLANLIITNPQGAYEHALDVNALADGEYTLAVDAYDMLENLTHETYSFSVDLAAPTVPTIVSPAAAHTSNQKNITIAGKATSGTEVALSNNGLVVANAIPVDSNGNYSSLIELVEGDNNLTVKAKYINRAKWSAESPVRKVVLNTQIPDAPAGFTATAIKQGQVNLSWSAVVSSNANNQVKGYNLYRSTAAFTQKSEVGVTKLNNVLVSNTSYNDVVLQDGSYYYAVAAVNQAGNESALSAVANSIVDGTGPKIVSVDYATDGELDSVGQRFGKGNVTISARFSEALRNAPYFAIVPQSGLPVSIELTKDYSDDQLYTGIFTISESTPSGTAYVVMSAHDNIGNRGTEIVAGNSLLIDTKGPEVSELVLTPTDPLKVDEANGLDVTVAITLNDVIKQGMQPKLIPVLDDVAVAGYEHGIQWIEADGATYRGVFHLPNTAAQSASATLSFTHQAQDDLNNTAARIYGQNQFQVYQGELPPLNSPSGLTATALPSGKIKLQWNAVEKAINYVLYRQGPGDTALELLEALNALTYEDQTPEDGTYLYAIASVRQDNGEQSESAKSETVSVKADRIAPLPPQNLELELNGTGIVSRWLAPAQDTNGNPQETIGLTYNLYRQDLPQGAQVSSLEGLTPIQTRIPALIALDTQPSEIEHSYFVTAVDAAGNESAPGTTAYLNAGLLPVNQLDILLENNGYPQLTWKHKGTGIEGYRVYRYLGEGELTLLTPELISHTAATTTFKDESYNTGNPSQGAGQEVVYSVVAVDANDIESPAHELTMPAITVALEKLQPVVMARGVFNQLMFRVDNKGISAANRLRLSVSINVNNQTKQHISEYFDVVAGANTLVPVVVGGYDKLDVLADLKVSVEQKPLANQSIVIKQQETVEVGNSSLTVDLVTQNFTRGGTGKAAFTITNNSDVETEVVVATQNGNKDSNEIRFVVEDLQGNLLNQQSVRQTSGGVVSVPSGHVVARIAPHETFTSAEFNINVPAAAPDVVKLRLLIDKYHYHQGKADHVEISGIGVSKDVQLADTPYYAEVASVSPQLVSARNGTVTVTGVVKERINGQLQPDAPIAIIYTVRGFERKTIVYSDASGNFTAQYKLDGTAGKYRVSAVHPDMTDKPNHGEFIAQGASISPTELDLKIPRNYTHKIPVRITAGDESQLNNLSIVQIPNGTDTQAQLPVGITVTHEPLATISANTAKNLNVNFSGDNTAAEKGMLSYRIEADGHSGANALGVINIVYTLSEATPAITPKPAFLDTGVGLEQQITEDIIVTNTGLDVLRNAQVELLDNAGAPVPTWVSLSTASSLGDMAVGDSRTVQLVAKPGISVQEGTYEMKLQIKGDNLAAKTSQIFIHVTQSGEGNAFFKISDIYTATMNSSNQLIEGLNGARVQLQNENVLSEVFNLNSNADGEALFEGIPPGRYAYRVSAFDHASVSGRIWVKPGVTSSEKVFLMNNLVNVEWSVREITIEDRYEIKLEATFRTFVPVALLMLEPLHVNLPVMKKGEVFQGEFTLTNYGLIRADNVKQVFPQDSDLVRFEFLKQVPTTMDSGQVFTMPYRIHALRDFNPSSDASATGGGCGNMNAGTSVSYTSNCAAGNTVPGGAGAGWSSNWGSCGGGGTAQAVSVVQSSGGSGGGGGWIGSGKWVSDGPNYCEAPPACDDDCNKDNASAQ